MRVSIRETYLLKTFPDRINNEIRLVEFSEVKLAMQRCLRSLFNLHFKFSMRIDQAVFREVADMPCSLLFTREDITGAWTREVARARVYYALRKSYVRIVRLS